jgi:putative NIF3 family GTP cyclohydrolase 1 type 2
VTITPTQQTALDSVKGGINDWLASIVVDGIQGSFEKSYVGAEKEDELGGEGRLVRFDDEVEMDSLIARIKNHLQLDKGTCCDYMFDF